ncbi:hypothetical protein PIB30_070880 [Stylosanthes scabra]|uniref:Uncharacterized protein n=1 Tax=Stylosanthes scabra TaxID=79078 RepID=A0ABU6SNQ8_9FABA|nr:hypothetical protein [Stylosanthes scabra]
MSKFIATHVVSRHGESRDVTVGIRAGHPCKAWGWTGDASLHYSVSLSCHAFRTKFEKRVRTSKEPPQDLTVLLGAMSVMEEKMRYELFHVLELYPWIRFDPFQSDFNLIIHTLVSKDIVSSLVCRQVKFHDHTCVILDCIGRSALILSDVIYLKPCESCGCCLNLITSHNSGNSSEGYLLLTSGSAVTRKNYNELP